MKCTSTTHYLASDCVQDAKEKERAAIREALLKAQTIEFQRLAVSSPEELRRKLQEFFPPFQEEYNTLVDHIVRIARLVQEGEHVAFLFEVRKALQTRAYDRLKRDEKCPAVHFLHALVMASYAEPRLLKAFYELGEHLWQVAVVDGANPEDFPAFFRQSRFSGYRRGLIKNDLTLQYVVRFFRKAWGSFLSIKWGRWLTLLFGFKKYDPRGDLENNAGALYEELFCTAKARIIYTPTPTVGDEVALEAKALLQALENRRRMDPERLKEDPYPYDSWCYVNLQNYASTDEGPRSSSIMRLNAEYPLSFSGITVAVNSPFYTAGVHGRSEKKIEARLFDTQGLTLEYKEAMKGELYAKEGGYYFPDTSYQVPLEAIVEDAYRVVIECPINKEIPQEKWNWYQKAAFRELVILGMIRFHVAKCALHSHSSILVSYACKESMDRGGKINAAFLWALGEDTFRFKKIVFSALHGRPLLSRGRLILADRLEPLFALQIVVSQPKVRKFLHDIAQSVGVHSKATIPLTD